MHFFVLAISTVYTVPYQYFDKRSAFSLLFLHLDSIGQKTAPGCMDRSSLGLFPLLCQKPICRSSEQPAAAISHANIYGQTIGLLRIYRSLLFLD